MIKMESSFTTAQLMDEAILGKFFISLNVRPRSVADYKYSLKSFFGYLTEREIEQPTREHVFAYRNFLIEARKKPSTVHAYIAAVKVFFRWAEQEGLYGNIAETVKVPSPDHEHRRDALTAFQALALLNHVDRSTLTGLRNYAMLAVMLVGGLRCVEVARANVRDLMELGGNTNLYVHGKGHDDCGAEYVKLSGQVRDALMDYLNERGALSRDAVLFASIGNRNHDGRLSTRMISKIVKDLLLEAGLNSDRLCAHSLRHTAVTLALKGGETLEAVKDFARHTNINTTLVYSHAIDRERSTCSRTIEEAIFGKEKPKQPQLTTSSEV